MKRLFVHALQPRRQVPLLALAAAALLVDYAHSQAYEGRDASHWVEMLNQDDVRERWFATVALSQIGPAAGEAVVSLSKLLAERSQYEYVRAGAAMALGRIRTDPEQVVPLLEKTIGSDLVSVRLHSARALGRFGKQAEAAVPAMLQEMRRADPLFRIEVAEALWRVARHPQAIPFLVDQLEDQRSPGRFEAAEALGRIGLEEPESVTQALADALGSDDRDVARSAARSLGRIGGPAMASLALAAKSEDERLRLGAVAAHGWMGPAATSELIAALNDSSAAVRRAAVRELGRLGPTVAAVEPALLRAVNDMDPQVRATAASALKGSTKDQP